MLNKPLEYYIAVCAAMGYVAMQHKDKPWWSRTAIAAISGGIGYALAADFAHWTGRSEVLGAFLLTAFSYVVLDLTAAMLADRGLIRDILRQRFGGQP